jgi:hypothetical protein
MKSQLYGVMVAIYDGVVASNWRRFREILPGYISVEVRMPEMDCDNEIYVEPTEEVICEVDPG